MTSSFSCVIACAILFFGYVDLQEGNAAWLNSAPGNVPHGNTAVRTIWGLLAVLLCPWTIVLLFVLARNRTFFTSLPIAKQWLIATGVPILLLIVLISLCAIGSLVGGPLIIPFPQKQQEVPNQENAMHSRMLQVVKVLSHSPTNPATEENQVTRERSFYKTLLIA
ncbi:MAG: hypothetical protein KDB03_16020 [Planctomycetales bacterium]|nr:hypothetical protein [Planctomycetales bacterium]